MNMTGTTQETARVREIAKSLESAAGLGDLYDAKTMADTDGALMVELRGILSTLPATESHGAEHSPTARLVAASFDATVRKFGLAPAKDGVPSMEEVGQIIDALSASSASLQERSTEALEALLSTLNRSVPDFFHRLQALAGQLANKNDAERLGQVEIDATTNDRLTINGEVPASVSSYMNEYVKYGQNLLGPYTKTAIYSVMQASVLQQGVDGGSVDGFWNSVNEKLAQFKDPRAELTSSQMNLALPGCGPLFSEEAAPPTDVLQIKGKLERFVTSRTPIGLNGLEYRKSDDQAISRTAWQVSDIRDSIKYLMDLFAGLQLTAFSQSCQAAWMDIARTNEIIRTHLTTSDPSLLAALNGDDGVLMRYLDTLFGLAAWPTLNYLTNLVLFGNAFIDFAEASLKAEPPTEKTDDQVAAAEAPAEGETEADDPNAEQAESTDDGKEDTSVDVGENKETGDKPTSPGETPDTGETPDQPQDMTGEGERAVVKDVDKTIAKGDNGDAPAEGGDDEDTSVDVSAAEETDADADPDDTSVDVAAAEEEEEDEQDDSSDNEAEQEDKT